MADQPKKKTASQRGIRNDNRKNGKAPKQGNRTRGVRLTELQKALLGGGAMVRVTRPAPPRKVRTEENA